MVAKCVPPAEIFKEVLEEWSHDAGSASKERGRGSPLLLIKSKEKPQ